MHLDQAPLARLEELDHDPGRAAFLLFHPLEHRLDRVLQQVGQSLGDLLGITIQLNIPLGKACFEPNAGARPLLKVNGLAHQILP